MYSILKNTYRTGKNKALPCRYTLLCTLYAHDTHSRSARLEAEQRSRGGGNRQQQQQSAASTPAPDSSSSVSVQYHPSHLIIMVTYEYDDGVSLCHSPLDLWKIIKKQKKRRNKKRLVFFLNFNIVKSIANRSRLCSFFITVGRNWNSQNCFFVFCFFTSGTRKLKVCRLCRLRCCCFCWWKDCATKKRDIRLLSNGWFAPSKITLKILNSC